MTPARVAALATLLTSATTVAAVAQRPVFEMTGRVLDAASGEPVAGAAVVVEAPHISGLDRNRRLPSVMSGNDGGFRVPGLAAGAYGIRVLKPGYFERGGMNGGDLPIVPGGPGPGIVYVSPVRNH